MNHHAPITGKLKIFFGMAPGVGKTVTMLKAGLDIQSRGSKVAAAYVETHGDPDELQTLSRIEQIPLVKYDDDSSCMGEMDLDAVLRIRPDIVLIDRMEHINHPRARHRFRHQDIQELLDHGISVYTTLNVHHVESLIDIVYQITGIRCSEIVPDSMLDRADDIELVDMPQDELLAKFTDSKINVPDYMKNCARDFYRKGNLTALREIALRTLAKRVNLQLTDYMHQRNVRGPWKTNDRIVVAIDASVHAEELIRMATHMAMSLEGQWYAVHVRDNSPLTDSDEMQLKRNFMLVRELGGELIATADTDIAEGILRTARQKNASQIIVGKSTRNRFSRLFRGGSIVDRLIKKSGSIDIHVVENKRNGPDRNSSRPWFRRFFLDRHYLITCGTVLLVSVLSYGLGFDDDYHFVGLLLLFAVSLMGLFANWGPTIVSAALGALLWDLFFKPPQFELIPPDMNDLFLLAMYLIIPGIVATLTTRIRNKDELVQIRERQSSALLSFVESLSNAHSVDDILSVSVDNILRTFNAQTCFYYADQNGNLENQIQSVSLFRDPVYETALWVYTNNKPAGKGTDTFQRAKGTYYPLSTESRVEGVIGIHFESPSKPSLNHQALLLMFIYHISLALEKERLTRTVGQSRLIAESERLYKTLFNSISHELRTPLATLHGASSSLMDERTSSDPRIRTMLAKDIFDSSGRLNRLVENLLNMSRLESGRLNLRKSWCDPNDIFNITLNQLARETAEFKVKIEVAPDFPFINVDEGLFTQVISNVVLNATQYAPKGSLITLRASFIDGAAAIQIDDNGPGFPDDAISRVFDKFYRVPGTATGGTGLGLSIVKGYVEAHGATISAGNLSSGGARITIILPSSDLATSVQEIVNG